MSRDEILSTIACHPVARLVYSSFGFFARRRGRELPGSWFLRALAPLGPSDLAVRQTLYRLRSSGELTARRVGRHKLYRASPYAWAAIDAGAERLAGPRSEAWDGRWTLVHARFEAGERHERDQVRTLLETEGFAPLGPGAYVHPRERAARLLEALRARRLSDRVTVVRGTLLGVDDPARFVRRHWDLSALASGYRAFLDRFGRDRELARAAPAQAFAVKLALTLEFLRVAWADPDLPDALLPQRWPGHDARRLVSRLNDALLPRAIAHADAVLEQVLRDAPPLAVAERRARPAATSP